MEQQELAGYTLLAGYGLLVLLAIRVFGLKRVLAVILGLLMVGLWSAIGSLRAITDRRR